MKHMRGVHRRCKAEWNIELFTQHPVWEISADMMLTLMYGALTSPWVVDMWRAVDVPGEGYMSSYSKSIGTERLP